MTGYFLDTNIIVDIQRKKPEALDFFAQFDASPTISAVTIAELFAGVRDGEERVDLERFLEIAIVIELTHEIAKTGGLIQREFRRSHGTDLADSLIAACYLQTEGTFYTLNARHFPMIDKLVVPY